jgi:hypothetical protein
MKVWLKYRHFFPVLALRVAGYIPAGMPLALAEMSAWSGPMLRNAHRIYLQEYFFHNLDK